MAAPIAYIPSNNPYTVVHTYTSENSPSLCIKYHFDIDAIDAMGVPVKQELEDCVILGFFRLKETIYPVLIRRFYETAQATKTSITGKVLDIPITIDYATVAQVIGCERIPRASNKEWVSDTGGLTNVEKVLMKENEKVRL